MSDIFVDNIKHQSSQGSGTITIGASGEKVDLGATAGGTLSMSPAFYVRLSAAQTGVPDTTYTKVNFDTADINLQNAFDTTTNYRFTVPSGYAGKYFFYGTITYFGGTASDVNIGRTTIYKNGAEVVSDTVNAGGTAYFDYMSVSTSVTLDLSVNDYVELYGFIDNGANTDSSFRDDYGSVATYFQGYRLIGV